MVPKGGMKRREYRRAAGKEGYTKENKRGKGRRETGRGRRE